MLLHSNSACFALSLAGKAVVPVDSLWTPSANLVRLEPILLLAAVNIMKEGKVKKARRKDSPKPAEPQSGARRAAKLLPGAKALAKPLPRKRAAPTSTRPRSALKPLKTLQSHLSGVLGLPRPAPNLLYYYAARRKRRCI